MICPYCDSLLKETPESGTCPNCGGALASKGGLDKKIFPEPPIGLYKDSGCADYIEIGDSYIRIFVKVYFSECDVREIPFGKIGAVSITPGSAFVPGYLTVRTCENMNVPMPSTYWEAIKDRDTILFDSKKIKQYFKIYRFLQECANIANKNK